MAYGAISLVGGVVWLTVAGAVWWAAAGDLLGALLTGDATDVVVGLALVGPFAARTALVRTRVGTRGGDDKPAAGPFGRTVSGTSVPVTAGGDLTRRSVTL